MSCMAEKKAGVWGMLGLAVYERVVGRVLRLEALSICMRSSLTRGLRVPYCSERSEYFPFSFPENIITLNFVKHVFVRTDVVFFGLLSTLTS